MSDTKKVQSRQNTSELFIKKIQKKERLELDTSFLKKAQQEEDQHDLQREKHQHKIEVIEAPIYNSMINAMGLSHEVLMKVARKRSVENRKHYETILRNHKKQQKTNQPRKSRPKSWYGLGVFQNAYCIYQRVPIYVDTVAVAQGPDEAFVYSIHDPGDYSTFVFGDVIYGTSSWDPSGILSIPVYHRHRESRWGAIVIGASAELTEASEIYGMGIDFERLSNGHYSEAAGDTPTLLPPSRASIKKNFYVKAVYRIPNESKKEIFESSRVTYYDSGNVTTSDIDNSVLGSTDRFDLHIANYLALPAGTQISIMIIFEHKIEGFGDGSWALVQYHLSFLPYINIKSCRPITSPMDMNFQIGYRDHQF